MSILHELDYALNTNGLHFQSPIYSGHQVALFCDCGLMSKNRDGIITYKTPLC